MVCILLYECRLNLINFVQKLAHARAWSWITEYHVEAAESRHKQQITLTIAGSGTLLPFQILYGRKTERCHSSVSFPDELYGTHRTIGHIVSIKLVTNIILPYISKTRQQLGLGEAHMALVIFDAFKDHMGEEMLMGNRVQVTVPSNYTDLLQPLLALSVNKPLKDHIQSSFGTQNESLQLQDGKEPEDIAVNTHLLV